jgi:hypothetical protein
MKKLFTVLVAVLLTAWAFAQAPEKMSYQAVIRNTSNQLVISQTVGMRISILQGSSSGTSVYVELQFSTTNANGLVSVEIGTGALVSGNFATIDWANGPYFIKTETDPLGGTNYTITGVSQLLSVPYALYAKTAETLSGSFSETDPLWSGSPSFGITNTNISNWNSAFGWGNHASAGYLSSFTETDPLWSGSPSFGITNTNISNWNSAFGWGNHASAGYLSSFTENDPLWSGSPSFGITNTNISNWNSAFGWGNHASAGYLTSFTEDDPTWDGPTTLTDDIARSGNVGIGVTAPVLQKFVVSGSATWRGSLNEWSTLWSNNDFTAANLYITGGDDYNTEYSGMNIRISGTNGFNTGLYSISNGVNARTNRGVVGYAVNGATGNRGIMGIAEATSTSFVNEGVYGYVTGNAEPTGTNYGGRFIAAGTAENLFGVRASANDGGTLRNYGIYAESQGITSVFNVGGAFFANSSSTNSNYGLYTESSNAGGGLSYAIYAEGSSANYAGYFSGDVTVTGTFSNPSDIKLKKNINEIESVLPNLMSMDIKTYEYNSNDMNLPKGKQFGLIAQDLEKIYPELVNEQIQVKPTKEGSTEKPNQITYKAINYIGLIPILTKAIQEQQSKINFLEDKIKALEEKIDNLAK